MIKAFFILVLIFVTNLVGIYFGLYLTWWFDISMHFLGGFFMAMLMVNYLIDVKCPTKLKNYLVIIGAVSFIGVVWEFAEYVANQTLIDPIYNYFRIRAYFIGDLDDTMNDLLMDVIGAFIFLFRDSFKILFRR